VEGETTPDQSGDLTEMKTVYTATETIDKHINDGISRVRGIIVKEQTRVVEDMDAYRDKMLAFGMETETFSHVKTHGWVFSCFKNRFIYRSVVVNYRYHGG